MLDVLIKSGIADSVTTEEERTSVEEVAGKAGMNVEKLVMVMRFLTAMDIFVEVKERCFRLTKLDCSIAKTPFSIPCSKHSTPPLVQDVKSAVRVGRRVWREEFPEGEGRVEFMVHDFFRENPVKGADMYYMRASIHGTTPASPKTLCLLMLVLMKDWPDHDCVRILKGVAASMSPKSRLLINEMLVELLHRSGARIEVGEGEQGVGNAPEPLPPNYGDRWQFQRDHQMMLTLQGKERNREDFIELVGKAGLVVERFWTLGGVESAIIECRLK